MKNKTKILLLSFYAPPDLSAGSFRVGGLLAEAKRHTDQVEIDCLTTMPNRYHDFDMKAASRETYRNISIHRSPLPPHGNSILGQIRAYISYVLFVERFMRQQKHDYDIVVSTSSPLMTAALGAFWARRLRKPLYLDIRDLFLDTFRGVFPSLKTKLISPFIAILEKWTMRQAAKINLVSQGFVRDIRHIAPSVEFGVITNGIDEEFLEPLSYHAPGGERFKILYAGNVGEGQGLEKALPKAAKKLEDIADFHIVGSGGRMSILKKAIKDNNVSNVIFHPPVARSELKALYSKSDILYLQLNKHQAFEKVLPSKLFEYAATGKPILAGISGYAAYFINSQIPNSVVVEPCSEHALVKGVMDVINYTKSPTDRSKFVEKFDRRILSAALLQDILNTCDEVSKPIS